MLKDRTRRRRRQSLAVAAALWISAAPTHVLLAGPVPPATEEAASRGLVYLTQWPQAEGHAGFGCGFADLDGDHDPDVILVGAAGGQVGIFENDGTGYFTDRSAGSGLPLLPEASGVTAADYDGDGDIDLYLTQIGLANVLARNDGNFRFTNVAGIAGVGDIAASESACFGDYDGDGWLDLYVANYRNIAPDFTSKLFRNLGNGAFQNVSAAQGVDDDGYGFQAVWFDYDRDGDVDLYLSNDKGYLKPSFPNQLWRNDDGQLVNVTAASGTGVAIDSMGVACGDLDGNGWPDLYCTNTPGTGGLDNPLLLNQGDGTFVEAGASMGVDNPYASWGSIFYDCDNNGHLDLYVNNVIAPNTLYLCVVGGACTESAAAMNVTASYAASFGSAVADVDLDGDVDLLVNNLGVNVELFINHADAANNWIRYRMIGEAPNHFAVGGNVDTRVGGVWQFREIYAGGNGYLGQNELTIHVGLGGATVVDEIVVSWPGGATMRTLTNLPANQVYPLYPPQRLGDVDESGVVNVQDINEFVAVALGLDDDVDHVALSDMDGDWLVTGTDLAAFVQALAP